MPIRTAERYADGMRTDASLEFIRCLCTVLVEEREKQGLSKNELSARTGIDRAALVRAERGDRNPGIAFFYDWCRGLDVKFSVVIRRAEKLHDKGNSKP
jgi:transcriptional regulator with XRE-family HTH domain